MNAERKAPQFPREWEETSEAAPFEKPNPKRAPPNSKAYPTRPGSWPLSLEIALTVAQRVSKLTAMVVHLKPETESRLQELAATTGRAPDELIEDAMTGYLAELTQLRNTLDSRYDEIKSGRVKPVDGEEAFVQLRQKSQDRRRS